MDLYTYYRSTSSYRVRLALALKGLDWRAVPVNLLDGEQRQPAYRALNPQGRVPSLRLDSGEVLIQSPAILEYLEERYPAVPLLPAEPLLRARHRGIAALIGCDIHPLHNAAVLNRLRALGLDEPAILDWISHWIGEGLAAVEAQVGDSGFCFGERGLADVYLLPQLYAARRFQVDLSVYPRLLRVEDLAAADPAFQQAHPALQADSPERVTS
ncbi:maleylacetoacetate isomerase [Pseudomonas sp. MS15a(2019)]|uniref:maleylacetoacetate isomerase n=1 Tax=Pseudomonas sp. MS15a(2019) TaxID=2579938 RepID=UPI0015659ECB|nr:maleylacetoacetate isomerase [Pseudomonas sp. MS15a(2019)]NRH41066.1 maleylacetoacetate isomerase [Pseudomonas sp. MS15a(2019)]